MELYHLTPKLARSELTDKMKQNENKIPYRKCFSKTRGVSYKPHCQLSKYTNYFGTVSHKIHH